MYVWTHTPHCAQRPESNAVGMVLSFYLYGASWQETQGRRQDHPALYSLSYLTTPISCTFSDFFHECGMSWWQIWVVVWTVARIRLHDKGQLRSTPRLRLCWLLGTNLVRLLFVPWKCSRVSGQQKLVFFYQQATKAGVSGTRRHVRGSLMVLQVLE